MEKLMSLRNKIILTLLLIFTIYMVTSYLILNHTLYPAFKRLEQNAAADNLKRVQRSLALDLQHIADIATDWGYWDDAYEFVANKNQRFIESNLANHRP
jgi:sensor domain CHASE-containing protein